MGLFLVERWVVNSAIPLIALFSFVGISSGSVQLFGLPRAFLLSVLGALVVFWGGGFRLSRTALLFCLAYIAGMSIGTMLALIEGRLEVPSAVQLVASLFVFCVLATVVERWLLEAPPYRKTRSLDLLLAAFAVLSVVDIIFYMELSGIRQILYDYSIVMTPEVTYNRDIELYAFPRPVCLFSEASNFARFIGIVVGLRFLVGGPSGTAFSWLFLFVVLTRSPTIFFSLPLIVVSYLGSGYNSGHSFSVQRRKRLFWGLVAGAIMFVVVAIVQSERVERRDSGDRDGSFGSRVETPLRYIAEEWSHPLVGSGMTPHNEMQDYVLAVEIQHGRTYLSDAAGYREGIAPSAIVFVAMGLIGLLVFSAVAWLLLGISGLYFVVAFYFSNFLSAGYNSVAMFIPLAFMFPAFFLPYRGTS